MIASTPRREFLKTSGMLVVGIGAATVAGVDSIGLTVFAQGGPYPDPDFHQLDSVLAFVVMCFDFL